MRTRIATLGVISLLTVFTSATAHSHAQGRQEPPAAQDHDQHHPATGEQPVQPAEPLPTDMMRRMEAMKAADQKFDQLVKKMNAATGAAKTDVIAELLTALVQEHRAMHDSMMSNMSSMMNMMGHMKDGARAPKK